MPPLVPLPLGTAYTFCPSALHQRPLLARASSTQNSTLRSAARATLARESGGARGEGPSPRAVRAGKRAALTRAMKSTTVRWNSNARRRAAI